MVMLENHEVTVNVDDVLAIEGNTVPSFVLVSDTFGEQPVQNAEVNMPRLELPTIKLQVSAIVQAVLETVQLHESAFTKRDTEMFPAQLPDAGYLKWIIHVEPFYLGR